MGSQNAAIKPASGKSLSRRAFLGAGLLLGAGQFGRAHIARSASIFAGQPRAHLRVVSLNVWALPLLSRDTPERMTAIVRRLSELDADIVGLQEVWTAEAREAIISEARRAGALVHHTYYQSGIRESGLLTLSRFPVREDGFHRFRLGGRPERWTEGEYYAGKGVGLARLQTPAGEIDVYNFHLIAQYVPDDQDPYRAHRTAAAHEVVQFVSTRSGAQVPVLLMGDLNMQPDALGYELLTCVGGFTDSYVSANPAEAGHTRSGANPYTPGIDPKRIDFLFTRDGQALRVMTTASRVVMDEPPPPVNGMALPAYSDHYGVLSEVEVLPVDGGAVIAGCRPTRAIHSEFRSLLESAVQEARARQRVHYARSVAGAVAAPMIYTAGHTLSRRDPVSRSGPFKRTYLTRRRFLSRTAQVAAVTVAAPYALLHGWLGLSVVPAEIRALQAVQTEVSNSGGAARGGP